MERKRNHISIIPLFANCQGYDTIKCAYNALNCKTNETSFINTTYMADYVHRMNVYKESKEV